MPWSARGTNPTDEPSIGASSATTRPSSIEKITTATATYVFQYDAFGNMSKITVNGHTLISNTYEEKNGNLTQSIYGNQDCVKYAYDNVDRITDVWYNDYENGEDPAYSYTYNANGDLSSHTDHVSGLVYVYMYDHRGNISQRTTKDTDDNTKSIETYKYDEHGRLVEIGYSYFNAGNAPTFSYCDYTYDDLGNVKSIKHGGSGGNLQYTYDGLGRLNSEKLYNTAGSTSDIFTKEYDYNGTEVEWVWGYDKYDNRYDTEYEYDAAGNITKIEITGDSIDDVIQRYTYQYDSKNQLTRENLFYGTGNSSNRTIVYTYDSAGNILSKKQYAYTEATSVSGSPTATYSYGYAGTWKDRLTSFAGKSISYDAIGNPKSYGSYTYDWQYGRQLASISNSSTGLSVSYQYNDEGIRTVKIVNGVRHEYDVVGGQINREVIYSSNNSYIAKDIRYFYDANGNPSTIRVFARTSATATPTKTTYYLQTNLQGDVIAIYNKDGTKIYEYAYDAWGNIIKSAEVATGGNAAHAVNPFRYRGYYYDSEIGLYYLQSRYYNPEWGRFLNADGVLVGNLLGDNLFLYCENNPISRVDEGGEMWQLVPFLDPRTPFRGGGGSSHGRGFGTQSNYNGYEGSAYGNYLTGANVSNYDANIGGYNSDWTIPSFNDSCRCWIPGVVSVTDDMALNPQARFSEKKDINKHIFRLADGHFALDTTFNRNLLQNATSPRYYAGTDVYGNMWYSRTDLLVGQIWVRTRNGIITDGGFNIVERPWDPVSGFCNRPRK